MRTLTAAETKKISAFMADRKALVASANATFRPFLRKMCTTLGMRTLNVDSADTFDEADEKMKSMHPQFVFADAKMGTHSGFELLAQLRAAYPSRLESFFFLISESSSPSVAARAMAEEVDGLIVPPITIERLEEAFMTALEQKMAPTDYTKCLENGKTLLSKKMTNEALKAFSLARRMDGAPVAACYWEGTAHKSAGAIADAMACFEEGLTIAPGDLRCSEALLDLSLEKKDSVRAYELAMTLVKAGTIDPKRVPGLVRLSLQFGHYKDVEVYYDMLAKLEQSEVDEQLSNSIAAGLVMAGKQVLKTSGAKPALELFRKAEVLSKRKPAVMKQIVLAFFSVNDMNTAREILGRCSEDIRNSAEVALAEFELVRQHGDAALIVQVGMDILARGINKPEIFEAIIKGSVDLKRRRSIIEDLIIRASGKCPENRELFEKLLPDTYSS